ncbi:hypothetical protein VUR80DRAFT_6422 [Thermomyces stellatus]
MCVIYEIRYVCGDTRTETVPCNDTQSPGHQIRRRVDNQPDVCNRSNCRNPNTAPAEYKSDGERNGTRGRL